MRDTRRGETAANEAIVLVAPAPFVRIPLAATITGYTEKAIRRTLGAGTELAKGQSWCFAVDMRHQEISGHATLTVLNNVQGTPTAPAGNLKAVP